MIEPVQIEIKDIIINRPIMLSNIGKVLNTWKLLLGFVPEFEIYEVVIDDSGEIKTLDMINNHIGVDDNGIEYNILEFDSLVDISFDLRNSGYVDCSYCKDVVVVGNKLFTIYELLDSEIDRRIINSIPAFDHTKIKLVYNNSIFIGYQNIDKIVHDVQYFNIKFKKYKYGYVKKDDLCVPFSTFYNCEVNQFVNSVVNWNIPILDTILDIFLK